MEISNKVIVVTGGGNGIGRALCRRFAAGGARAIVVADIDAGYHELRTTASSKDFLQACRTLRWWDRRGAA